MRYVVEVAKALNAQIFVEKIHPGKGAIGYIHKIRNVLYSPLFLRCIVIFFIALYARMRGTTHFYIHYSFVGIYATKLVTAILGGKIYYWNCGLPWKYKRPLLREMFERYAYRCVDIFVTGAHELTKGYISYYGIAEQNIRIIPNWIDLNHVAEEKAKYTKGGEQEIEFRKKYSIGELDRIILFVHKVVKRKGADYIVDIAKALEPHCVLVVLGDGSMRAEVEHEIKTHGLNNKVRFTGFVNKHIVHTFFAYADLFVMPSEEEGFPHALLEAMAFDIPFVVTKVGGVIDMVPKSEHTYVVPHGDKQIFITKIYERLNSNFHPSYGDHVAQYDKKNVIDMFAQLFS